MSKIALSVRIYWLKQALERNVIAEKNIFIGQPQLLDWFVMQLFYAQIADIWCLYNVNKPKYTMCSESVKQMCVICHSQMVRTWRLWETEMSMVSDSNIWPFVEVAGCFAGSRFAIPERQEGRFWACSGEASGLHKAEGWTPTTKGSGVWARKGKWLMRSRSCQEV